MSIVFNRTDKFRNSYGTSGAGGRTASPSTGRGSSVRRIPSYPSMEGNALILSPTLIQILRKRQLYKVFKNVPLQVRNWLRDYSTLPCRTKDLPPIFLRS